MSVAARRLVQSTHRVRTAMIIAVAAVALAGCSDAADLTAPAHRGTSFVPAAPIAVQAEMIATVDLDAGTMTFEPVRAAGRALSSASGISAAIYGNQGVTLKLYNTPVIISASSTPGKKLFSAMVGVKNLLAYPIGDEQGGPAPLDTIGIDVFMVQEPVVTSTSSTCVPACTVTMRDHHGTRAFTAPNQKYWHWNDRLSAVNGGSDTTLTRTPFTFEADSQVRNFSFSVILNAPWPAPYETRAKVDYQADSLPTSSIASRWRAIRTGNAEAPTMVNGLELSPRSGEVAFYRLDSLAANQDAYIEARIRWNGGTNENIATAEPRFMLADASRLMALGVFSSGVGFVDANGALVGTRYNVATTAFRTYQLRKYAADSVVFFVDGVRGGKALYSALPATPFGGTPRMQFGARNAQKPTTSTWDYVIYELGVPTP